MNTDKCNNCTSDIKNIGDIICPTCGNFIGYPNVREVGCKEEINALNVRYQATYLSAQTKGTDDNVRKFKKASERTKAVLSIATRNLSFILNSDSIYRSYGCQVNAGLKKPSNREDDKHRTCIDSILFGHYKNNMFYCALSLDGSGLKSYGEPTVCLSDIAIKDRATILEENSFIFFKKNDINKGIPKGYRAIWDDRSKLAVAKKGSILKKDTPETEYAKILLRSTGDRETDDFMEIHVYGGFDISSIEYVKGKTPKSREGIYIEEIKERLTNTGKKWIEE